MARPATFFADIEVYADIMPGTFNARRAHDEKREARALAKSRRRADATISHGEAWHSRALLMLILAMTRGKFHRL